MTRQAVAPASLWPGAALCVVLLLGIFFRVYHVDRKVYWIDEAYTSIHLAGVTEDELVARSPQFATMADLRRALQPAFAERRPLSATVASLAREDPQHPPLYYALAYFWTSAFGMSIEAIRSISVAFGILALPLMFWLCRELFGSRTAAWLGTALLAVSPVFVLYSQEAREYALWTATTIWMSAALLRAIRVGTTGSWLGYAVSFAIGLYTYPLTFLVALAHGVYVLAPARFRVTAAVRGFALSSAAAVLAFSPWLVAMYRHRDQIALGLRPSASLGLAVLTRREASFGVLRRFFGSLRLSFLDVNPLRTGTLQGLGSILVLALIGYSLYRLYRATPERTWLFVATLMFFASIPVLLLNLTLPEGSSLPRYYLPLYLSIILSVTGCIALGLAEARSRIETFAWQAGAAVLFTTCILSCSASSRAETWWNKLNDNSIAVARTIAASAPALLISDNRIDHDLVLSNYLPGTVAVLFHPSCELCRRTSTQIPPGELRIADAFGTIYLLGPSAQLKQSIERRPRKAAVVRCIGLQVGRECRGDLSIFPAGW